MCHLLIHSLLNNFIASGLYFSLFVVIIARTLNPGLVTQVGFFIKCYPLHLLTWDGLMPSELSKCVTLDSSSCMVRFCSF